MTKRNKATTQRRRLIVESAAACFLERGFHQTSTRDIAGKAGISLGNLYNHFENKAALVAEIAFLEAEELANIENDLAGTDTPARTVERFVQSYFDYVSLPETAVLAAEITAESMRNPDIAKGFVENRERLVAKLAKVLRAGKKQAEFTFDGRPRDIANLMLDLIESAGQRVAFDRPGPRTQTRKSVFAIIKKSFIA